MSISGLVHPTRKGQVRATPVIIPTVAGQAPYTLGSKAQFQTPYEILGFSHRVPNAARKTESNQALVSDAIIKTSFLHLKKKSTDEFMVIPMENLLNDLTGYRDVYWIEPGVFDFQNSVIVLADILLITAGNCFELMVYTTDPNC